MMMMSGVACASEEGGHHGLSTDAPVLWDIDLPFWPGHSLPITNSMVMMTIAVVLLTIILRLATRKMQSVPSGLQNFVEWAYAHIPQQMSQSPVPRQLQHAAFPQVHTALNV